MNYSVGQTIEYLPEGYYRCEKCKTLVPMVSSVPHVCITSETQIAGYTIGAVTVMSEKQLLEQILYELQEIKKLLRKQ